MASILFATPQLKGKCEKMNDKTQVKGPERAQDKVYEKTHESVNGDVIENGHEKVKTAICIQIPSYKIALDNERIVYLFLSFA